ncbi:MAG: diacylglycerol kinase family lipid kinase [Dehalococcoidia bacterium]|nr:diacylglycerol kinase family lipid kinase [Dehalococcoidia bacterium]
MPDLLLIVNPRSANGSTGRRWPAIEGKLRSLLPPFDVAFSERPLHATAIAREATGRYGCIALVGGDGTVNEVANGLIADDRPLRAYLTLGIIPRGTGADIVRTLGIPRDLEGAAERLAMGKVREIDVGKVRYHSPDGSEAVRYFLNEGEIGMGAAASDRVNRSSKRLGGRLSFLRATLITALSYRPHLVNLSLDGAPAQQMLLTNVWLANGQYSGGGIRMAPRARLDDGLLDVVCIGSLSRLQTVIFLPKLRSGAFIDLPQVTYLTARRIEAESEVPVLIEVEGEAIGSLPATFELIGERLKVIA